ncbi:MAG: nicotinate-nucleotide adenylyltransferase [bacterium]
MMKLGIMGGTFDPIHIGHLIVAENVRVGANLNRVIFIPNRIPPHKAGTVAPPEDRYEMVRLAIAGNPFFELSDIEMRREGRSYTVDTMRALRRIRPEDELYLIIGADAILDIASWKETAELGELCKFLVLRRPGFSLEGLDERLKGRASVMDNPLIGISSTEIRRRLSSGKSIRYLVPEGVRRYIETRNLYK